jgi:hypothetical protein
MVFLKFEVSAVFADSPIRRCRGVKETKEGVAKLETSLAITSIPLRRATPILECKRQRMSTDPIYMPWLTWRRGFPNQYRQQPF